MSTLEDERIREAIIERATDWFLRHRNGRLTPAEEEEFLEWLRASPQHTGEYLAVARLSGGIKDVIAELGWQESALAQQAAEEEARNVIPLTECGTAATRSQPTRASSGWRGRFLVPLIAASLLVALGALWFAPPGLVGVPRAISVARGEQRTVQLLDGSVMHVNARSHVKVRYSRDERLIELDRGQALFNVARDSSRPFRVRAGSTEVVAIGTQFDVYRRDSLDVTVTVVQGKVEVIEHSVVQRTDAVGSPERRIEPIRLQAGEQLQVKSSEGAQLPKAQLVDVRAATAWVRREIVFEGRPLGEVAEEFNRYIPVPIEIEDPDLLALEVSGVFNAYDSDSFLVFLQQYDTEVERGDGVIHVRPRKR